MNGWELNRQKRADIEEIIQGICFCIPIPFLMSLKLGVDLYILGPAYFLALIRRKRWQPAALLLAAAGVMMLGLKALRWKYGILILLFWLEERYLEHRHPLYPFGKRCVFYVTGLLMVVLGLTLTGVLGEYQLIYVFLESVFLMGAACLYQWVLCGKRAMDELTLTGISLTVGTMLAAFHWVQLGQVIPAEILLLSIAMVGGYELGIGKGMSLALPAAFFMRLSMTAGEGLVILCTIAILLAGGFRELGRKAAVASVFSGGSLWIILFMGGENVAPGILTLGMACLVFGLWQRRLLLRLVGQVKREEEKKLGSTDARKRYMEHQIGQSAEALRQVAQLITVPDRKRRISGQDLVYLKEDIAGRLCQECENQRICWGKQYARTHETVVRVMEATRQKGRVQRNDLPAAFLDICKRPADFVKAVNRYYELYRLNQSWENRMAQSAYLVQGQYESMALYLEQMKNHMGMQLESEEKLRRSIEGQLKRQGLRADRVAVMANEREDRIWIHLDVLKPYSDKQLRSCLHVVSELAGRPMVLLESQRVGEERIRYRLSDPNRFELQLGCVCGQREEVSGDSYTARRLDAGRYVVALGDGMGSGAQAHEASERALALLEQLLLSGMEEEQAVHMLNTALVLTEQGEVFTTIDLALLNLHTGEVKLVKAGSCTTFLRSRSAVYVYRSQSLPVGILNEPEPETYCHPMQEGDVLLMISDGVLDQLPEPKQGERWIRRYLLQSREEEPQRMAEEIRNLLMPHLPQVEDDQTILVLRIEKKGKLC